MTVPPPLSLFNSIYRSRFGLDLDLGLDVYWMCKFVGDSVSDKLSHITSSALGCSLVYILHRAYSILVQGEILVSAFQVLVFRFTVCG
jgi:hypothetical protein